MYTVYKVYTTRGNQYHFLYPSKTNVFWVILNSACLSVRVSVHVSVCVQNTSFKALAGEGGIKSHLVTALVCFVFTSKYVHLYHIVLFGRFGSLNGT